MGAANEAANCACSLIRFPLRTLPRGDGPGPREAHGEAEPVAQRFWLRGTLAHRRQQEQEAQEGEEVVQKAMKIKDNPKVQALFDKIKNDPSLAKVKANLDAAVQKVMKEHDSEST